VVPLCVQSWGREVTRACHLVETATVGNALLDWGANNRRLEKDRSRWRRRRSRCGRGRSGSRTRGRSGWWRGNRLQQERLDFATGLLGLEQDHLLGLRLRLRDGHSLDLLTLWLLLNNEELMLLLWLLNGDRADFLLNRRKRDGSAWLSVVLDAKFLSASDGGSRRDRGSSLQGHKLLCLLLLWCREEELLAAAVLKAARVECDEVATKLTKLATQLTKLATQR